MNSNITNITVPEIYSKWKEQWKNNEFYRYNNTISRYPEIVYRIRESKKVWSKKDIVIFSNYLRDKQKKRFVADLFAVQEQIPEDLFEPFIDAAINDTDPSSNQDYINPCLRVFGFVRVAETLDLRFLYGNKETKKRVGWAYYWVRPPLVTVIDKDKPPRVTGYKPKWNGLDYNTRNLYEKSEFEMTTSEVETCKREIQQMKVRKRRVWMEEFLKSTDGKFRDSIKRSLPNELTSFAAENQKLAKIYLAESHQV